MDLRISILPALASLMLTASIAAQSRQLEQPNVLLICVDDLRTHLGCYGHKDIITPNIDQLAGEGRLFKRHYVTIAACGPSRVSMLTGRFNAKSWDIWAADRKRAREPQLPVSMPHLFRRKGYRTVCIGKVSHSPGGVKDIQQKVHEVPFSWDKAFAPTGPWKTPWGAFFGYEDGNSYNSCIAGVKKHTPRLPYEAADVPDTGYPDGLNAKAAIEQLQDLAADEQPFFLAVGFYKPHLPFCAPKKYWDLYDPKEIGLAENPTTPAGVKASIVNHKSYELTHYKWPWGMGKVPNEQANKLRHGYYACTSYVDAQIGKVLKEYKRLGLEKNTVVVLWSDHGYHLGEQGMFCKFTNYEIAAGSPLIIKVPSMPQPGTSTQGLVETIDLYPTLAELCSIPVPTNVEGKSIAALVRDPTGRGKEFARTAKVTGQHTNRSLRTDRWRLILWHDKGGKLVETELYDHKTDLAENVNVAPKHPEVVKTLSASLKAAYPKLTP